MRRSLNTWRQLTMSSEPSAPPSNRHSYFRFITVPRQELLQLSQRSGTPHQATHAAGECIFGQSGSAVNGDREDSARPRHEDRARAFATAGDRPYDHPFTAAFQTGWHGRGELGRLFPTHRPEERLQLFDERLEAGEIHLLLAVA